VTETLYLDVTDPNGIQLTALDEAIAFNAGALQISDVRGAAGLAGLGSYETASSVDNTTGVLLVGQAFMGSGLPPLVPFGTDVPVLQWNVAINANAAIGSALSLTLLQDGEINGQTKFTAISDNEGALTWTPGMAPGNNGNAAIDGSVTVVPAAAPVVSEPSIPTTQRPVEVRAKVVERLNRVIPVSPLPAVPSATVSQVVGTSVVSDTGVTLVTSLAGEVAAYVPTAVEESATGISLPSTTAVLQSGTAVVNIAATVMPTEMIPVATAAPSLTKGGDPAASLSMVGQGMNRSVPSWSTGTSNAKPSTNSLDEMYRQFGLPPMTGYNPGVSGNTPFEELPDVWDLDYLLLDQDFDWKSDELVTD
jgi:hypothetical protein